MKNATRHQQPGNAIVAPAGCRFTGNAILWERTPAPATVKQAHAIVVHIMRAVPWLHGDALQPIIERAMAEEKERMGEKFELASEVESRERAAIRTYAVANDMTEDACRKHFGVAKMFPPRTREDALSFYHHFVCWECRLTLAAAKKWLARAHAEAWTAAQMREQINATRMPSRAPTRAPEPDIPAEVNALERWAATHWQDYAQVDALEAQALLTQMPCAVKFVDHLRDRAASIAASQ